MMLKMMKYGLVAFLAIVAASPAFAAKSIKLTKHNLSNWSPYALYVKGNTTQVCVFCHAPHNADSSQAPLWNRQETDNTPPKFQIASSLYVKPGNSNVTMDDRPTTISRKCLSCHDGTVAIGAVVNRGTSGLTDDLGGDATNGSRVDSGGFLKSGVPGYIGTNLSGGHVISFKYDSALVTYLNGRPEYTSANFKNLNAADTNSMLDRNLKMQCHTCHDPHTDRCNDSNSRVGKDPLWRKDCDDGIGTQTGIPNSNETVCATCHDTTFDYYTSKKIGF